MKGLKNYVLEEWHIRSEFHVSEEKTTKGRMGDIRCRPTEDDLKEVRREPPIS